MTLVAAGAVLTPEATLSPGWVRVRGPVIAEVGDGPVANPDVDLTGCTLAPGFVDQHCHGGGGFAFTDGAEAARHALAAHLRHGTTSMVASLVTDTLERIVAQANALRPLIEAGDLLGVHLEGPWLSAAHCGAHDPALLRDPAPEEVADVLARTGDAVVMVTLATERRGGADAVRVLGSRGVIAALGHSDATYAQATDAVAAGVRVATHLFNAERKFHHREPGLVLALAESPQVRLELIADAVHVHPAALRSVFASAGRRCVLVTDAMAAAAAADGSYDLGPLHVEVTGGVARLADGTIAGSTLTLDEAVRLMVMHCGVPLADAVYAASTAPADALGRGDIGRLSVGARADMVVLDSGIAVARVMRAGTWVV